MNDSCLEVFRSGGFGIRAWIEECTNLPYYPEGMRPVLNMNGPIICADEVVASNDWRAKLIKAWPKSQGVEMESGGVVAAWRAANLGCPISVIRGVSDMADPLKTDDSLRMIVMQSAALLYVRYLRAIGSTVSL